MNGVLSVMGDFRSAALQSIPCAQFTFDRLAEIYNDTRVDYIVPMPMNARRMAEYVHDYDVDMQSSLVALDGAGRSVGMGMLALRDNRAWITRLGVSPAQRGRGIGSFMMQALLERARARGAQRIQLEVIKGNDPAHVLFLKCGFRASRELLVLSRAPSQIRTDAPRDFVVLPLTPDEIAECLRMRTPGCASWIDETPSLMNGGSLAGFRAQHESGISGWIVLRKTLFQLSHFVFEVSPDCPHEAALALLDTLHRSFPTQDAKYENHPANHAAYSAFAQMGYLEVFRRIEMSLQLA
jgi:ribosomal protein S18 acetylase RimI-like enzyme